MGNDSLKKLLTIQKEIGDMVIDENSHKKTAKEVVCKDPQRNLIAAYTAISNLMLYQLNTFYST